MCPGDASSKRKRSSVPSSSLKRRIPVRRRNQVIILVPYVVGHVFAYTRQAANPRNPPYSFLNHTILVALQYTPTLPSAIPSSFFHGMGAVHPLMVLTEILMPRGGGGHLFGVVSANGGDSDVGWVSTSNEEVR